MNNHCVVLTCTVKPNSNVAVTRNNPDVRIKDYVDSILKWHSISNKLNFRLIVIENSNSLEILKNKLPKKIIQSIIFHQSSVDVHSERHGISAGEFLMLKDSISVMEEMQGVNFCWKVTGRLFVRNFNKICEGRDATMKVNRFYLPRHLIDSRFFGISFSKFSWVFSQNIEFSTTHSQPTNLSLETSIFPTMEDFLSRISLQLETTGHSVHSFNQIPIFEGVSASTGKKLNSFGVNAKIRVANRFRKLAIKMIAGSAP